MAVVGVPASQRADYVRTQLLCAGAYLHRLCAQSQRVDADHRRTPMVVTRISHGQAGHSSLQDAEL